MGIKQSLMRDALRDIEERAACIDDIGSFDNSWEQHLSTMARVLTRLENNNVFIIDRLKCNGEHKKLIGLVAGSHHKVGSHGKRRLRLSSTSKLQQVSRKHAHLLGQ
jgi:hypothetical protein